MPEITDLPHVLAAINSLTVVTLITGFIFIRRGERHRHKAFMVASLVLAVLFLAVYLYYHANAGLAKFGGEGLIRPIYFTILIAHIIGAVLLVPLVPTTVFFAVRGRFPRHRKLARWTLPLWLYVSASGVVVYVMAVHIFPSGFG